MVASESAREVPLGALATLGNTDEHSPDAMTLPGAAQVLTGGTPHAVLAVDDAHMLDDVSAALLNQLVTDRSVRLLLTVRSGEPAPDAVTALWKDGLVERLDLQPLDERAIGVLLESVLDGRVDGPSRRRLCAITQGNVLWLRHLVEGERAAGRLAPGADGWQWTGAPEISPVLRDLITARIGRLSEAMRHLVELLAFGEPLGLELLSTMVEPDTVDDLAQRGLISVAQGDRRSDARLAHPLYGEAARSRTNPLRARRLRGELAAAFGASGVRRRGDTLRRAVLILDSDLPVDPDLLTAAAAAAAALTDRALAERLARCAVDADGGFEPKLILGMTYLWQARGAMAETELAAAAGLACTEGQWLRAGLPRVANLLFVLGEPEEAGACLDAMEAAMTDDGARTELAAVRSNAEWARCEFAEAVRSASLVLTSGIGSDRALTWVGNSLVIVHGREGSLEKLTDAAARSHVAAVRGGAETAVLRLYVTYQEVFGYGLVGNFAPARERIDELRVPDLRAAEMVGLLEGRVALDTGRTSTAIWRLGDSRAIFRGDRTWTAMCETPFAQALAIGGDLAGARGALSRAEAAQHRGLSVIEPELMVARAWVAAAEGAVSVAVGLARRGGELAGESGQFAVEVVARHAAVCFGDVEQASRLAVLAGWVDGPRAPAAAAHAAAWAAKDSEALSKVSEELERCELLLLAADAAAQAAVLYRERAGAGAAVSAGARAVELARRCEGARTPALVLAGSPLAISAREREVATLAGAGLSNREIAERLRVSVRTVEGHFYRACTRLDVADRTTLAALVARGDR